LGRASPHSLDTTVEPRDDWRYELTPQRECDATMPRIKDAPLRSACASEPPTKEQFDQMVQTVTDAYQRAVQQARLGSMPAPRARVTSLADVRQARLANLADTLVELATTGRVSRSLSEFERDILRTVAGDLRRQ
jgi:DNA-binding TFAR19-related protein (PDSD5 family)